jgi:hypothetical protein
MVVDKTRQLDRLRVTSLLQAATMSDKDVLISMGFDPARVECMFTVADGLTT